MYSYTCDSLSPVFWDFFEHCFRIDTPLDLSWLSNPEMRSFGESWSREKHVNERPNCILQLWEFRL